MSSPGAYFDYQLGHHPVFAAPYGAVGPNGKRMHIVTVDKLRMGCEFAALVFVTALVLFAGRSDRARARPASPKDPGEPIEV